MSDKKSSSVLVQVFDVIEQELTCKSKKSFFKVEKPETNNQTAPESKKKPNRSFKFAWLVLGQLCPNMGIILWGRVPNWLKCSHHKPATALKARQHKGLYN